MGVGEGKKKKGGTIRRDAESHPLRRDGWLRGGRDVTQDPWKRAGEWLEC